MKSKLALLLLMAALVPCLGMAAPNGSSSLGLGTRYHVDHSVMTVVPYENEFSYGLSYEYREGDAYWQLALQYSPDMKADGANSAWTRH